MAISIIRQGNTDQYNIIGYCCDTREDVFNLPENVNAGSTCLVIEDSSVWMLNNQKEWKEL